MKITFNLSEKDLIEYCLNLKASGFTYDMILSFYALSHRWNINKLINYISLIENGTHKDKS